MSVDLLNAFVSYWLMLSVWPEVGDHTGISLSCTNFADLEYGRLSSTDNRSERDDQERDHTVNHMLAEWITFCNIIIP